MNSAIELQLDQIRALFSQGLLLRALERAEALALRNPETCAPNLLAGQLALEALDFERALKFLLAAAKLNPKSHEALAALSFAQTRMGDPGSGLDSAARSLALCPNSLVALLNATSAARALGDDDAALRFAEQAFEVSPSSRTAINNLFLEKRFRDQPLAWDWLRQHAGDDPQLLRLVASESLYLSELSEDDVAQAHGRAADRLAEGKGATTRYSRPLSVDRKIRIGLLGGDFRQHAVASFLLGWLPSLDESNFELEFFSTTGRQDNFTGKFKALGKWHELASANPTQIASVIHLAGIDILLDLGGYTGSGCPEVLVSKPAPITVSMIGYARDLGLDRVNCRLGDELTTDTNGEQLTVPTLKIAPSFINYLPLVERLPKLRSRTGPVVFGCYNNAYKLSSSCLRLWRTALQGRPLVLKSLSAGGAMRDQILKQLAGVEVRFLESQIDYEDHLAAYGEIDVALDTFPYSGTTTTLEALSMGVPVVTLLGPTHRQRVSASILRTLGREEWIAATESEYQARIQGFERQDGTAIREQLLTSILCDGQAYASEVARSLSDLIRRTQA